MCTTWCSSIERFEQLDATRNALAASPAASTFAAAAAADSTRGGRNTFGLAKGRIRAANSRGGKKTGGELKVKSSVDLRRV